MKVAFIDSANCITRYVQLHYHPLIFKKYFLLKSILNLIAFLLKLQSKLS